MIKDDTVEICGCVRIMSWFLVDTKALRDCEIQRHVSKQLNGMREEGMGLTGTSNNTHCEPFPSSEFGQYSS